MFVSTSWIVQPQSLNHPLISDFIGYSHELGDFLLPVAQASQGIDLQGRLDRVGCVGQMHRLDCHVIGIPAESTGIEIYRVMN